MNATVENTNDLRNLIQFVPFKIDIKADYTEWDKLEADIEETFLVFKQSNSTSDSQFLKKETADITVDDTTKIFTVNINQADFETLKVGTYTIRLGILFNGETQPRDVGAIQNGQITITESWFDYVPLPE